MDSYYGGMAPPKSWKRKLDDLLKGLPEDERNAAYKKAYLKYTGKKVDDGSSSESGKNLKHPELLFTGVRENVISDQYIYFNANLHNGSNEIVPATFSQTRGTSIIDVPKNYKMSVVRFDVASSAVKFIFADNKYDVTMSVTGIGTADNPEYLGTSTPLQLVQTQINPAINAGVNSQSYYGSLIESYNTAAANALGSLIAVWGAANGGVANWPIAGFPTTAPKLVYEAETKLFKLYCEAAWVINLVAGVPPLLWHNHHLHQLLQGFVVDSYGIDRANKRDVNVWLRQYIDNIVDVVTLGGTVKNAVMSEEVSSVQNWYDLYKIILVASDLDVRNEFIGLAGAAGSDGKDHKRRILSDFSYEITGDAPTVYGNINFIPTGVPRYIDIENELPLKDITLEFKVESRDGSVTPLYLSPGQNMNIKLLFQLID